MSKTPDFVVNIIKMFWSPGKKILEIGCGPALLRREFGKDYTGVDIISDPYSLDLLRDVDIVCSADNLQVRDNSIDIVVIKSAFYLFDSHTNSLKESLRVLKPNGKLLIFDYNKRTQKVLQKKEGHNRYPCWTQWDLKKLVQSNGFKNVDLLLAEDKPSEKLRKTYRLLKNEFRGTWAIVCGTK